MQPTFEEMIDLPCYHREVVPEAYMDALGHMSFPFYLQMFNDAWWKLMDALGTGEAYAVSDKGGVFALEHHMKFLGEVNLGDTVAVHTRILGHSPKRMHYIMLLVNETQRRLATTSEGVGSHADLVTRRTTVFSAETSTLISTILNEHTQLAWEPPVCGILKA